MTDSFKIALEIAFHFDGHAIFQKILLLCQQFGRQIPNALFGILAIRCTAKIHIRINKPVAAVSAFSGRIVFEKFDGMITFRAFYIKNCSGLPVLCVLPGTFHRSYPFSISFKADGFAV